MWGLSCGVRGVGVPRPCPAGGAGCPPPCGAHWPRSARRHRPAAGREAPASPPGRRRDRSGAAAEPKPSEEEEEEKEEEEEEEEGEEGASSPPGRLTERREGLPILCQSSVGRGGFSFSRIISISFLTLFLLLLSPFLPRTGQGFVHGAGPVSLPHFPPHVGSVEPPFSQGRSLQIWIYFLK